LPRAPQRIATVAIVFAVSLISLIQPAVAVTPLVQADLASFSSRAEAWTLAREAHRDAAHDHALELAGDARQVEEGRLAEAEAERLADVERQRAEEVAARTTTTTTAPALTTTAPPTVTAPATTTVAPAPTGTPTATQWEALRRCESSGNYGIVSANGRFRGAYQFSQATWDWVASIANPALVGLDPAAAPAADQDAMALALWSRQGWSPWPICGAAAAAA
jgi:hypothetical protein